MAAMLIGLLTGLLPLIAAAPELAAEIKDFIAGLDPNAPAATPAEEQAAHDIMMKVNAEVQTLT